MEDHNYCEETFFATPLHLNHATDMTERQRKLKSNRICCVPECHTTGYKHIDGHGKPSFHRFPPKSDPLREKWVNKIKRDEDKFFQIQSHTVVCSLHFAEDAVEVSGFSKRRYLKPGAVPTIFECWRDKPHLYKTQRTRPENRLQKCRRDISPLLTEVTDQVPYSATDIEVPNNQSVELQTDVDFQNNVLIDQINLLQSNLSGLEQKQAKLIQANEELQSELQESRFCVDNVKQTEFQFYTGFQSRKVFDAVLQLLDPGPKCENIVMVQEKQSHSENTPRANRTRKLSPDNQFLLFLCRIKLGLYEMDLAKRFGISVATVSNIIISWTNFVYMRLGAMDIWPSRATVDSTMPESFKRKYPTTRAIIDCTEIKVEMPSSLLLKSQTYSNYKSSNTLKGLIAIAPCGSVTFISELYHGSISDREITIRSGLLDLPFDKGDSVMADKGFDIQDLLDKKSVRLNIPPFLSNYGQLTEMDVFKTQSIAAERIHVERAINKIKNFHIFDQVIPVSLFGSINQIWTVCALLTLFQDPILSCTGAV